jgi:hypothetical protein
MTKPQVSTLESFGGDWGKMANLRILFDCLAYDFHKSTSLDAFDFLAVNFLATVAQ